MVIKPHNPSLKWLKCVDPNTGESRVPGFPFPTKNDNRALEDKFPAIFHKKGVCDGHNFCL